MINLTQPCYKEIEAIAQNTPSTLSFSQGALRLGGVPQSIKEEIAKILTTDDGDYYTPILGYKTLRTKIAERLNNLYHLNLTFEHIAITHGSINALSSVCLTLLSIGDEVLIPEPTYPAYSNCAKIAKANPVFVNAFKENFECNTWYLDMEVIKKAIRPRTKMLILPNPSNPCGVCLTQEELNQLFDICTQNKIYLLVDEVYENYVYQGTFNSSTPLTLESEYVIRIGSFSKDFAMSGWRIGFIVAQPQLFSMLTAVQDSLICCPSAIGQYAALHALENTHLMAPQREQMKNNYFLSLELLNLLIKNNIFTCIAPQAGFFLFLKTNLNDSTPLVFDILQKAKVALVPGKDFGPSGFNHLRLCFARKPDLLKQGFDRLYDYFKIAL